MDAAVRPLRHEDWPAVYRAVWRPVVAAGETYLFDPRTSQAEAERLWCLPRPARQWWVDRDGEPVATALLKPNQPGAGSHIANAAVMVAPWASGQGLGRLLAEWVLGEARRSGYRGMQFNAVVAGNTAAVGLRRSLGFAEIGRVPDGYRRSGRCQDLLIMYRDLALALTEC